MKYKKELAGTGHVFAFTLKQLFKNKANIFSMVILFLVIYAMPLLMSGMGDQMDANFGTVEEEFCLSEEAKVYLIDETNLGFSLPETLCEANVTVIPLGSDKMPLLTEYDMLLHLTLGETGVKIKAEASKDTIYSEENLYEVSYALCQAIEEAKLGAAGLSEEQLSWLASEIHGDVYDETELTDDEDNFERSMLLQYVYSIVVMMMSVFAISYIMSTVVEEKSSKLVELLLVSVRPLALMVGKIFAAMVYVICLMGLMLFAAVSSLMTSMIVQGTDVSTILEQTGMSSAGLEGILYILLNPMTIGVLVISLLLGYMTFALMAGVCGASCNDTQDMQGAMTLPMVLIMGSYIMSVAFGAFDSPVVCHVVSLIPFLSIFFAPVQYMLGNISILVVLLTWILQGAIVLLLVWISSRVYEGLILYRGNRMKLGAIVQMAMEQKGGKA